MVSEINCTLDIRVYLICLNTLTFASSHIVTSNKRAVLYYFEYPAYCTMFYY